MRCVGGVGDGLGGAVIRATGGVRGVAGQLVDDAVGREYDSV